MWAGLSLQPATLPSSKIFNSADLCNNRCSICNRFFDTLIDRTFTNYGILHRFKNICFNCNHILEKAFLN